MIDKIETSNSKEQKMSLEKKLHYFFSSEVKGRSSVANFVLDITGLCDISIFGGMLRDLHLGGNRSFDSDVDLVITNIKDPDSIKKILLSKGAVLNKFGGYRIDLGDWEIDLWELKNTWAFKKGYIQEDGFDSLLGTSFFNWDAIAYDFQTKKILCRDSYFSEIDNKILKINFEPNPNPLGILKRIYRFVSSYDAKLTSKVVDYYLFNYPRVLLDVGRSDFKKSQCEFHQLQTLYDALITHKGGYSDFTFKNQGELLDSTKSLSSSL